MGNSVQTKWEDSLKLAKAKRQIVQIQKKEGIDVTDKPTQQVRKKPTKSVAAPPRKDSNLTKAHTWATFAEGAASMLASIA